MANFEWLPTKWANPALITTLKSNGNILSLDGSGNPTMAPYDYTNVSNVSWQMGTPYNGSFTANGSNNICATNQNGGNYANCANGGVLGTSWQSNGQGNIISQAVGGSGTIPNVNLCDVGGQVQGIQNNNDNDACKWIDFQQALQCCGFTGNLEDNQANLQKYCGTSYTPGGDGNDCADVMINYCQGRWDTVCQPYLLNGNFNNPKDVRRVVQKVVSNGLKQRNYKYDPNDTFFTKDIPTLCGYVPGACDDILKNSFCNNQTRNSLIADTSLGLQKLCGCFLPESEYHYSGLGVSRSICDPICIQNDPIAPGEQVDPNSDHWDFQQCKQNVCIIDDVTIDIAKQTGNVNLTQDCGCKKGGSCLCYISNVSFNGGIVNGDISIDQSGCGQCFKFTDDIRTAVQVDCQTGNPIDNGFFGSILTWLENNRTVAIIVLSLIMFLIIGFTIFLLRRPSKKSVTPVYY